MFITLRTLALTIPLFGYSASVLSADWYALKRYETSTIYIDRDSIEPLKNSSVKLSYKLEQNDESAFMKGVTIMRCKNKMHTLQVLKIARSDQNFNETRNIDEDEQKTVPVAGFNIPLYKYVCKI